MFYNEIENNLRRFDLAIFPIRQIKTIANICRSTVVKYDFKNDKIMGI
jgi:hypothetical protein